MLRIHPGYLGTVLSLFLPVLGGFFCGAFPGPLLVLFRPLDQSPGVLFLQLSGLSGLDILPFIRRFYPAAANKGVPSGSPCGGRSSGLDSRACL